MKKLILLLILAAIEFNGFSQEIHRCIIDEHQDIHHLKKVMGTSQKANTKGASTIYEIPVVVHVLYKTSTENISTAQIQSQIDVLNEDYSMTNSNSNQTVSQFAPLAADTKIRFVLADTDPNGNPTSGITRKQTSKSGFEYYANEAKKSALGGVDPWDVSRYLNLWVVNEITVKVGNQLIGGTLGYAQFPNLAPATDGVVIKYNVFGRTGTLIPPYNGGRTATHEVGHWLGLFHLWGVDAQDGCNTADDDFISDTPLQGTASSGCNTNRQECGGLLMTQNFMDYSDDNCMTLFTEKQKDRMRNVIETIRTGFLPPNDLDYDLAAISINNLPAQSCGNEVSPSVTIRNNGVINLSSFTLKVTLNGNILSNATKTISIAAGANITIDLGALAITSFGNNALIIEVSSPNGQTDEDKINNSTSANFNIEEGDLLEFSISKDSESPSLSWLIKDGSTVILSNNDVSVSTSGNNNVQSFCVASGCHDFVITNAFTSDLCRQYPQWNSATQYAVGDEFVYQGKLYRANSAIWGVDPITFWQYFDDLGPCPSPNPNDNFTLKNLSTGTDLITKTVANYVSPTSQNFCIDGGQQLVVDFSVNKSILSTCETVTFTPSITGGTATTIVWDFGSGANPMTASGSGTKTVKYSSMGQKTVTLTVDGVLTNKTNFVNVNTVSTSNANSSVQINENSPYCSGNSISFSSTNNIIGTSPQYEWLINNVTSGSSNSLSIASPSDESTVKLKISAVDECGNNYNFESNTIQLSITPSVTPSLNISLDNPTNSFCVDSDIDFTATSQNLGSGVINWYVNDNFVGNGTSYSISGATQPDDIKAIATSSLTCATSALVESSVITTNVSICTSIDDFNSADIEIYPNPVNDIMYVSGKEFFTSYRVRELKGNLIQEVKINDQTIEINTTDLPKGIYFLELQTVTESKYVKFIKI